MIGGLLLLLAEGRASSKSLFAGLPEAGFNDRASGLQVKYGREKKLASLAR